MLSKCLVIATLVAVTPSALAQSSNGDVSGKPGQSTNGLTKEGKFMGLPLADSSTGRVDADIDAEAQGSRDANKRASYPKKQDPAK